ncbi:MAG: hypothetical protein IKP24_04955 [Alphaproteobacteria bacterium]|nr:hypothetical protein [Alphaproteobacteria bacterium]
MIKKLAFLALGIVALPQITWAAPCSRINLTKCLDSGCAINLSSNPAARCQYCGTADAGLPAASAMKSVSAGTSSKNTISAKELKNAPTDPGERYVWATKLCLSKVQNCTAEDVTEAYDPLIEKSCTAAGISNDMATLQKKAANSEKSKTVCTNEISVCITKPEKCDSNFSKCADETQFNNFFAACAAQTSGCTNSIDAARDTIATNRTSTLNATDSNLTAIVASYQNARSQKMASIKTNCENNTDYENCVKNACKTNTNNNCSTDAEQTIANNLCQFYKTACTKVK